jgi:hypothetical protein
VRPWWGRAKERRTASGAFAQAMSREQQRVQSAASGALATDAWHVMQGPQPAWQVTRLEERLPTAEVLML